MGSHDTNLAFFPFNERFVSPFCPTHWTLRCRLRCHWHWHCHWHLGLLFPDAISNPDSLWRKPYIPQIYQMDAFSYSHLGSSQNLARFWTSVSILKIYAENVEGLKVKRDIRGKNFTYTTPC